VGLCPAFTLDLRRFEFQDQEKPRSPSVIASERSKPSRKKKRNDARSARLRKRRFRPLGGMEEKTRIWPAWFRDPNLLFSDLFLFLVPVPIFPHQLVRRGRSRCHHVVHLIADC